ncbi:immunoglobulin-like domain-containing protein [Bacillus massiliigorillae]|uniref:immunoglobulin-like domain-containing protein n=1 Tax=Bacillus massiliigorillae TaxID=1243664 RepID=UPI0003A603AB|nr:immunoglobulin-like domain-containing protein [Bacillus massiliigorillae]
MIKQGEVASIYYENWGMNEIQAGSVYFIYKKMKNGWERMNQELAFTDILMTLQPTAIHVEHIDLKGLKEGSYKIIKGFYRDIRMGNTGFQLGVEFKISNKESK